MTKKLLSLILCIVMAVGACIGFTSCTKTSDKEAEITKQEVIDELVSCALAEADIRIEDYIDVSHFVNLSEPNESSIRTTAKKLAVSGDDFYVSDEQYTALTSSIDGIFSELTEEEYAAVKTLAEDDSEIAEMLQMVENDFEGYGTETQTSEISISAAKVAFTSSALATIGSILIRQGVANAAIIAIKGAFNTMIATLKAFFLPNTVKGVIITAAILVLATVVIINWNKILPVFNQIANAFIDNAKKLASTVSNVFNKIFATAVAATATTTLTATICGIRYEAKAKSKAEIEKLTKTDSYGNPLYYLAFASGISNTKDISDTSVEEDGLFIGSVISEYIAINILTHPTYITNTHDGYTFSYIPSVYTYNESDILDLLDEGPNYSSSTPRNDPEWHNKGMWHYHPGDQYTIAVPVSKGTKLYRPHAFFFNLDISVWKYYERYGY